MIMTSPGTAEVRVHHGYDPDSRNAFGPSYTSGLTAHGHPEFMLYTAGHVDDAARILGVLAEFVTLHGHTFQAGDTIAALVGGHDKPFVRLLSVANPDQRLPAAYYRHIPTRMSAYQVVYTDEGAWPWDSGYPTGIDMPLIGTPITTPGREYRLTREGTVVTRDW
jgi:hypothetical protein